MGLVVAVENLTLDGVMQAPGGAQEDTRGGFRHGGWAAPYADQVMAEFMGRGMAAARGEGGGAPGAMLFGRRTYEQFASFWPHQTDGNPFTEVLNAAPKYVVSRGMTGSLPWRNSILVTGDAAQSVARLKAETAGDLTVLGSGVLVRSLAAAGLVDRYVLSLHPLVLGHGSHLFEGPLPRNPMRLVESVVTTTGVIIASYEPVEDAADEEGDLP
jgi:dihydrofolate reductase